MSSHSSRSRQSDRITAWQDNPEYVQTFRAGPIPEAPVIEQPITTPNPHSASHTIPNTHYSGSVHHEPSHPSHHSHSNHHAGSRHAPSHRRSNHGHCHYPVKPHSSTGYNRERHRSRKSKAIYIAKKILRPWRYPTYLYRANRRRNGRNRRRKFRRQKWELDKEWSDESSESESESDDS